MQNAIGAYFAARKQISGVPEWQVCRSKSVLSRDQTEPGSTQKLGKHEESAVVLQELTSGDLRNGLAQLREAQSIKPGDREIARAIEIATAVAR